MAVPKPNIIWKGAAVGNYWPNREGHKIRQITMHHVVGDAVHAYNRANTPGQQFSPHFTIGMDGRIYQCVQIDHMAYTDNNLASNRRAVTIEHAGGKEGFPYTDAMYKSSAHLVAWLLQEYGDLEIKRHREVAPTACPGGLDVERIVREAKILLKGEPMADRPMRDEEIANFIFNVTRFERGAKSSVESKDYNEKRLGYLGHPTYEKLFRDFFTSQRMKDNFELVEELGGIIGAKETIDQLRARVAELEALSPTEAAKKLAEARTAREAQKSAEQLLDKALS